MATARIDIGRVAAVAGVDEKTVQRWLAGRIPYARNRWAVAALLGEDERYLWPTSESDSYQARFRHLWLAAPDEEEAIRQIQRCFGSTLPGQLINIDHRATIVIEPDGSASIEQSYVSANVSHAPLMTVARDIWFEHPQSEIKVRARTDRPVPMQVEFVRDFPNYKQLLLNFVKPLRPLEVVRFTYGYHASKMFLSDHFWDQRVVALTRSLAVNISHRKRGLLSACVVTGEFQSGTAQECDPDLMIAPSDDQVSIAWKKEFPEANGLYRIRWSFDELGVGSNRS